MKSFYSLIFRTIFHIFGIGSLNGSNSLRIRLTFFGFCFFQCTLILSLLNIIWAGRTSIFSSFDDWTHFSDNLQYFSVILMDGTVLIEGFIGQITLAKVNAMILDVELCMRRFHMDTGDTLEANQKELLKKFFIFLMTLTMTESSYYFSNFDNSSLTKLILLNFYLFLFKHIREFQFIFYVNLISCYLNIIKFEVQSLVQSSQVLFITARTQEELQKRIHLCYKIYFNVQKLLSKTIRVFHWSIMVIIFQNVIQLLVEFYWISFGIVNAPSKIQLNNYEVWPLLPCLIPKIALPLFMWKSCERCYKHENQIFHVLASINVGSVDKKSILMVSFSVFAKMRAI